MTRLAKRSETDQRAQSVTNRSDHTRRVERQVNDHAVDSRVQHLGLDLFDDVVDAAHQHALAHLGRDLVRRGILIHQHGQQDAGLQRAIVSGLVAPLGQRIEFARQLIESGDDVEMVGVARRDGEGLLFAAATDEDRDAIAITRFGQRRFGGVPPTAPSWTRSVAIASAPRAV